MRLVLGGIAALVAGFVVGLVLPSGGRHEIASANAELRAESARLSLFGAIRPKRFDTPAPLGPQMSDGSHVQVASLGTDVAFLSAVEETDRRPDPAVSMRQRMSFAERFSFDRRFSLDERFLFDQPWDSFDQRFAAVSPAAAPAMTTETENGTGSVPSVVRLPPPDPKAAAASPAVGSSAPSLASLTSPPPAGSVKKVRLASLEMPKGSSSSLNPDSRTAIYDITARTVYMPDGRRLEAHFGLGDRMDDPRYISRRRQMSTTSACARTFFMAFVPFA
jgi:hypothetical protein